MDPLNFSLAFSLASFLARDSHLSGVVAFHFLGPFGPLEPVGFCRAALIAFIPRGFSKLKFAEEVMSPVERSALNSAGIGLSFFVEDGCVVGSSSDSGSEIKVHLASSFLCSSSSLLSLVVSSPPLFSCISSSA